MSGVSPKDPFVVSLSNHGAQPRVLRQAQDERGWGLGPFAETARRLSGLTAGVLGWRPGEFWDATPAELAAVFDALRQAQGERDGGPPLSRAELNALMERDHG